MKTPMKLTAPATADAALVVAHLRDTAATLRTLLGCITYWCETADPVRPETADELAAQIKQITTVALQVTRGIDGVADDFVEVRP
jgi:hypothetical protein